MNSHEKKLIAQASKTCHYVTNDVLKKELALLKRRMSHGQLYAKVVQASRSGMSRTIRYYMLDFSGNMVDIANRTYIGKALDGYNRKREGYFVSGCGMDMVFNTLYNWWYQLGCPKTAAWKRKQKERPDDKYPSPAYNEWTHYKDL